MMYKIPSWSQQSAVLAQKFLSIKHTLISHYKLLLYQALTIQNVVGISASS